MSRSEVVQGDGTAERLLSVESLDAASAGGEHLLQVANIDLEVPGRDLDVVVAEELLAEVIIVAEQNKPQAPSGPTFSSYTSGQARWYFDDVPVVPGAEYVFSDFYASDVPGAVREPDVTPSGAGLYSTDEAPALSPLGALRPLRAALSAGG